jgi:hypothetical protein
MIAEAAFNQSPQTKFLCGARSADRVLSSGHTPPLPICQRTASDENGVDNLAPANRAAFRLRWYGTSGYLLPAPVSGYGILKRLRYTFREWRESR